MQKSNFLYAITFPLSRNSDIFELNHEEYGSAKLKLAENARHQHAQFKDYVIRLTELNDLAAAKWNQPLETSEISEISEIFLIRECLSC